MKQSLRYPKDLLMKARVLVKRGFVRKVSQQLYLVKGMKHNPLGYYCVEQLESGVWICNCQVFHKRRVGICSHIVAVILLEGEAKNG